MPSHIFDSTDCIFWGKLRPTPEDEIVCLPLADHALDVASVFQALCELPAIRRALHTAGRRLDERDISRLCVLVMLHDLGKFNLGFQFKVFPDSPLPPAGHIRELAALFADDDLQERLVTALGIEELATWFTGNECELESYLFAVWSHHGRPLHFSDAKTGRSETWKRLWHPFGQHDPIAGIAALMQQARADFPAAFSGGGTPLPSAPRFQHLFAGLVMLADWLGSHTHWFPIEPNDHDRRHERDRTAAARQLEAVGLDARPPRAAMPNELDTFEARFGFPPRPLQAAVHSLTANAPSSRLLIAESETGSGKTEAALDRFFTLFTAGEVDGLYFALPTRVAARELYQRVQASMERWFPDPERRPVTVLAVPGYAQVDGIPAERLMPDKNTGQRWTDDENLRLQERTWAIEHPKRFLAATIAVGTIDQALLSGIQTAHAHLRAVCLARSLLVVDEVHASDRYMSRLLEHLLYRHLSLGGHAMLLSATLGAAARARYLAVAQGQRPGETDIPPLESAVAQAYPGLSLASGAVLDASSDGHKKPVQVDLLPHAMDPTDTRIMNRILHALEDGARVLVVLNTVARANAVHRALEARDAIRSDWLFHCQGVTCPHHGRFAPTDRVVLDAAVSRRFGKNGPPGPVVLVGTQTLEQSLDIDADLLITDLAPADVLLQRIGRLHRHARPRPARHDRARCLILVPETGLETLLDARGEATGRAKGLGYGSVYEDMRTLELTLRRLKETPAIVIPDDNRRLVEAITHPEALARLENDDPRWQKHARLTDGSELAKRIQAHQILIDYENCFGDLAFHEAGQQVASRLGVPSLQLPLNKPVISPFGQPLHEMTIPGHMAPQQPDENITVVADKEDGFVLRCANRHYRYGRHGLEMEETS